MIRFVFILFVISIKSGLKADIRIIDSQDLQGNLTFELHNGLQVPLLGFGTAGLGENTRNSVATAIALGFRHIDTAEAEEWYSEEQVGYGIIDAMKHDVASADHTEEDDLFLVTKIHPRNFRDQEIAKLSIMNSLQKLQVKRLGAALLHFPSCWPAHDGPGRCPPGSGTWEDAWPALEDMYTEGVVQAIGVSNFGLDLLERLWAKAKVRPHIVQNWFDPFHQDHEVRDWCAERGIFYTGYSTFGSQWIYMGMGFERSPIHDSKVLIDIANRHQRSVTDVVLSWSLQLGVGVLPRSSNPAHTKTNARFLYSAGSKSLIPTDRMEQLPNSVIDRIGDAFCSSTEGVCGSSHGEEGSTISSAYLERHDENLDARSRENNANLAAIAKEQDKGASLELQLPSKESELFLTEEDLHRINLLDGSLAQKHY